MYNIINITCPGCANRVSLETKECDFCHQPILITKYNETNALTLPDINKRLKIYNDALKENAECNGLHFAVGLCYLKLGLYTEALNSFEKAISADMENADAYFYASICSLNGKRPFLHVRAVIDKIEQYIKAALMLQEKPIYYHYYSFIKHDYFQRKYFNTTPKYMELFNKAVSLGLLEEDVSTLFDLLKIDCPSVISL